MAPRIKGFFAELKRRKVYRVAGVYAVVGAGIIGLADAALPSWEELQVPVVVLILIGFPIALVLAWAYEVRPEEPKEAEPALKEVFDDPPTDQPKSIVVLPFDNMSPDPNDAYFSDGLTEEIITYLSYLPSLRVISRNSAMVLKGTQKDTPSIARELGVQYVLEGSVRKVGEDLRITAQLIEGASDAHLWADRYEGQLGDVFQIQDRVSRSIADALSLRLSPDVDRRLSDRPTKSPAVYECFLRARSEMWMLSGDSLDRALEWAERGLGIAGDDPDLLAMKANVLFQYVNISGAPPNTFSSLMQAAQECADRALSLRSESGWVQWALAGIRHQSGDPEGAIRHFDRALVLEPSHADAHMMLAYQLGAVGRHLDHARDLMLRAGELDPLTPHNLGGLGWLIWFDGDFVEALEHLKVFQDAVEQVKSPFRHFPAYLHAASGNLEEAIRIVDQMVHDSPDHILTSGMRFLKHAWLGGRDEALGALTDEWLEAARWDDIYPLYMAEGYALIGESDLASQWLDYTIDYGIRNPDYLRHHDPFLEPLRSTSRFSDLMEKADQLSEAVPEPSGSIRLFASN